MNEQCAHCIRTGVETMESTANVNKAAGASSGLNVGLGISDAENLNAVLDDQILTARENLARIIANFNGSENNKQIRTLRRRVLKKLLKLKAEINMPNA